MAILPGYIDINSSEFRAYLESKKQNIPVPYFIEVNSSEFRAFLTDANTSNKVIPAIGTDINSPGYRDFLSSL